MKTETFEGTIESAYGNTLATPVKYSGSFEAYENIAEVRSAKDEPSDDEVTAFVNNKRKANARQKAMQTSLDNAGIKKPTLDDPQVQLKEMIKILVTAGRSATEAQQIAEATLGHKLA